VGGLFAALHYANGIFFEAAIAPQSFRQWIANLML
jgi:hypothetical protein